MSNETAIQLRPAADIATITASRFNIDPDRVFDIMRATCFRQKNGNVTNEQMVALLVVANQYGLNPFTKEIYAFADSGGIVPVVGIDGWIRLANEHPQFDGFTVAFGPYEEQVVVRLVWGEQKGQKVLKRTPAYGPEWVTVTVHRKDRSHPIVVTEFLNECWRDTDPWNTSPARMLRHRGIIQAFRLAFGFAGIQGEDETEGVVRAQAEELRQLEAPKVSNIERIKAEVKKAAKTATVQDAEVVADAPPPETDAEREAKVQLAQAAKVAVMDAIVAGTVDPDKGLADLVEAGWREDKAQRIVSAALDRKAAQEGDA
jgi:phage recombination protein Bet